MLGIDSNGVEFMMVVVSDTKEEKTYKVKNTGEYETWIKTDL